MITIDPLSADNFQLVATWLSQNQINKWLTSEWRGRNVDGMTIAVVVRNKRNKIYVARVDGVAAGIVALSDIDYADRTAMVWYLLGDAAFSGCGVTTEALKLMSVVAFKELGLVSLYAWIMEDNLSSRRVLEKAKFRESGRLRYSTNSGGRQVDRVYFDLVSVNDSTT